MRFEKQICPKAIIKRYSIFMKFRSAIIITSLMVIYFFSACTTSIEPNFTFSPEMPKAGQRINFSNLTEEGKNYDWTFGDGGRSIAKHPSYTYILPGIYDVTLRVDSNDNFVATKQITVFDSIPSIYLESDTFDYFRNTTFRVLVFNPLRRAIQYHWTFSENARGKDLVNGVSTSATPTVFFTKKNFRETINLRITVGDSIYNVSKTIHIQDVKSRSLLMASSDGNIYRQRFFENGLEDATVTGIPAGSHPFSIQVKGNHLFIFDAGSHVGTNKALLETLSGNGNIRKVRMNDQQTLEIIHNRDVSAVHGFFNGYVSDQHIFWTDFSDFIYRIQDNNQSVGSFQWKGNVDAQTAVPFYFVKPDRLGYFGNGLAMGQKNGGVYFYDNVYFWAKGGSGKGIYRFVESDILNVNVEGQGTTPRAGAILRDFAIRSFAIDHINQKIYFSVTAPADKVGFWVANISGTNPIRIDNSPMDNPAKYITGIAVDPASNRVYWAYIAPENTPESYFQLNPTHRTGVKSVRLARNFNTDTAIQYFALGKSVYGLAVDDTMR